MRRRRGIALMSLGALLLAGAVGLSLYNRAEDARAGEVSAQTRQVLEREVIEPVVQPEPVAADLAAELPAEIQSVTVAEGSYIGVVEIPALDLALPVQESWSADLLRNAPCRYTGSFLKDDMIIAGHNYRRHFGGLTRLAAGDAVYFTDVDGNLFRYEVDGVETLDGGDVEGMLAGDWDLTLFTCTMGGQSRVTVRCLLSEDHAA